MVVVDDVSPSGRCHSYGWTFHQSVRTEDEKPHEEQDGPQRRDDGCKNDSSHSPIVGCLLHGEGG